MANEQIEAAKAALAELANVQMNLSLAEWGRISNAILAALHSASSHDVESVAKEIGFAGRMEHDMSADADDFWAHTVEDSRARYRCMARAALSAAGNAEPVAWAVKPLVWEPGVVDWARPMPGMKYVACSSEGNKWAWWLEGDEPATRERCDNERLAKAAAQQDYDRRIRSALEPVQGSPWQPIETAPKDGTEFQALFAGGAWEPRCRINPESEAFEIWGRVDYDIDDWGVYSAMDPVLWANYPSLPTPEAPAHE